jgi:2-polyprenyl-6-methoxyphenol hydroxylase-like FAD-dependent oxidoreductase
MPSHQPLTREQILGEGIEAWSSRLIALFEDENVPAAPIIAAQRRDVIVVGAEHDLPQVPTWHRNRVIIIGDAAHPASTSSGQGASMALEDAVLLGKCLRDTPRPAEAFTAFERLRRDRVRKVVALGAKTASSKAAGPIRAVIRDAVMRFGFRFFYKSESAAWLLRHHISWDEPVSTRALPLTTSRRQPAPRQLTRENWPNPRRPDGARDNSRERRHRRCVVLVADLQCNAFT